MSDLSSTIVLPVASVLRVIGRSYEEAVSSTSKYNQSLLRERRRRMPYVIDSQTRTRQTNSSLYHKFDERMIVTRPDQVCAYPAKTFPVRFRRQIRHNPYLLPTSANKIDFNNNNTITTIVENNESTSQSQLKLIDNPVIEIKNELISISNKNEDQILITNDIIPSNRQRRTTTTKKSGFDSSTETVGNSLICQYCEQRVKNKTQMLFHISQCQFEREQKTLKLVLHRQSLPITNESSSSTVIPPPITTMKRNRKKSNDQYNSTLSIDSNKIRLKIEKKENGGNTKRQKEIKIQAPTTVLKSESCSVCNEGNIIDDELIRCSTCQQTTHAYKCLSFENQNLVQMVKTYAWQCNDCKTCIQCGTVKYDDELLFCDHCDRAYHMFCLNPPLNEPPPGEWYCRLCS